MTTTEKEQRRSGTVWRGVDGHTYIRPIRTTGDRPPLICFFPGEPGARGLAEFLPDNQPIYEFHEPNMDGVSVFPTVEEVVATFLEDVLKVQAKGPYQLCGYSAMGVVAYEMARLLHARGNEVSFLGLFDVVHPRYRQGLTSWELARFRVVLLGVRLQKYGRFIEQGRFDGFAASLSEFVVKAVRKFGWRTLRSFYRWTNRAVPKSMQVIESVASRKIFSPLAYPRRIVLFRPKNLFSRALRDQTVGWHQCVSGGIDVHFVSGDHGSIVLPPHVRDLAEKMAPYLAPAVTGPSQTGQQT